MKNLIFHLLLFFLATASASTAAFRRDAAQSLSDLKQVDADVNKLKAAVLNWDGTTFGATPIQSAEQQLESDINKALTDCKQAAVASSADAQAILNYINNTLEPDIKACINALTAKKDQFKSAGLSSTIGNDVANLKKLLDQLLACYGGKAPKPYNTQYQSAQNKIDSDLAAYNGGCSGC